MSNDGRRHQSPNLLTPAAAAAMFGTSTKTLNKWVKLGLFPAVKLPSGHNRYSRKSVEWVLAGLDPFDGKRRRDG